MKINPMMLGFVSLTRRYFFTSAGSYHHFLRCYQVDCSNSVTMTTPIKTYSELLEKNVLKPDQSQFAAMLKLQELYNNVIDYEKSKKNYLQLEQGEESIEGNKEKTSIQSPKGLYIHGGVGTGKTLLLDLFYDCLPTVGKKRVHFNSFMLYLYSEINRWNLCCDDDDDVSFVSPTQHIANNILKDTWLLCFDEIQLADYASSTLLEGVFEHMISNGAIIVGTSNRHPSLLGDASITDQFDGIITKTLTSFQSLFNENCVVHHMTSQHDHRTEMIEGEKRFFHPYSNDSISIMNELFANSIKNFHSNLTSDFVKVYGRNILVPVSCDNVARFTFKELCCEPLGPADYIQICNKYDTIFLDAIPKMNISQKNEARRFLSFVDAVYESRVKLYCTSDASPDDLFLMLPKEGSDNYEPEQMHLEMIGEIAYDLKLHGMDFKSLNIISGEDEIFSFKRAISRLKEMQSVFYQNTKYRRQTFVPYIGTADEQALAEERRKSRELARQREFSERQDEIDDKNMHPIFLGDKRDRNFADTDWGDEASYKTLSRETMAALNKRDKDNPPKFGEQHFWGFGWWENVRNKFKGPQKK